MKVLGISGSLMCDENHDAAAALVIDGKLVGNYEEERFNRVKHSFNKAFPIISIKKLLKENNLTLNDIDVIAIPHDPAQKAEYTQKIIQAIDDTCIKTPDLVYFDHHIAHICDSVFQSGFEHCACLVSDGIGDVRDSITLAQYKDGKIEILQKYAAEVSVGVLYTIASVGMLNLGDFSEGKFMGLAPYGKPTEKMPLYWENNQIKSLLPACIDTDYPTVNQLSNYLTVFERYLVKNTYPYGERPKDTNVMYYTNLAASVQKCYEEITLGAIKYLKELTGETNLILSGGCIQNCIANNLIIESGLFSNVFAGPAPHDAGCAAGLAFYGAYSKGEKIENKRLTNSYVGKVYTDDECLDACTNVKVEHYDEDKVIKDLKAGKIFAWFQGGSEIGPRALGHRSLIADPSNRNNLFVLNDHIKHRENWRPLAPIIPDFMFEKVFGTANHQLCEFMLRTLTIKPEYRKKLIAVCHIDNSTRPQWLEEKENPELYKLIKNFYTKTEVPGLINTSFNGRGQPIIETPEQAIDFLKANEYLTGVIFNAKYVVTR